MGGARLVLARLTKRIINVTRARASLAPPIFGYLVEELVDAKIA
jgi:hypothetical protein